MKNVKNICIALTIALSSCTVAEAMNLSSLLEKLKANLPSWQSNSPLELPTRSSGNIGEAIEQLEENFEQYSELEKSFKKTTNDLLIAELKGTGTGLSYLEKLNPLTIPERLNGLFYGIQDPATVTESSEHYQNALKAIQSDPTYQAKISEALETQKSITTDRQIISCLNEHQITTRELDDFACQHNELLNKINLNKLAPSEKQLAQDFLNLLEQQEAVLPKCLSKINNGTITDYQHLIIDPNTEREILQNALKKAEANEQDLIKKANQETLAKKQTEQEALARQQQQEALTQKHSAEQALHAFNNDLAMYEQIHHDTSENVQNLLTNGFTNSTNLNHYLDTLDRGNFNKNCGPFSNTTRETCQQFIQKETESLNKLNQELTTHLEKFANTPQYENYYWQNYGSPVTSWYKAKADNLCNWLSNKNCSEISEGYSNKLDAYYWTAPYVFYTISGFSFLFLAYKYKYPDASVKDFVVSLVKTGVGIGAIVGVLAILPVCIDKFPTEFISQIPAKLMSLYQSVNITKQ